jgi:hypothetical protein
VVTGELEARGDAEQQVGAGQQAVQPELEAEDPAVGDHQRARLHRVQQPTGQLPLAHTEAADLGGHHRVGAALAQAQDLDLRERPPRDAAGPTEPGDVGRGVGHVQLHPVDGHQPPRGDPLEQGLQRRLGSDRQWRDVHSADRRQPGRCVHPGSSASFGLARAQVLELTDGSAETGEVDIIYVTAASAAGIPAVRQEIARLLPHDTVTTAASLASEVTASVASAAELGSDLGRWLAVLVLIAAFAPTVSATVRGPRGGLAGGSQNGPTGELDPATASHVVAIPLHPPVTAGVIVLAVVGRLLAGAFGSWRIARLRPADALALVA